jgi:hypothetical protein
MDEIFARRDLIEPALLRALSTRSDRAGFPQLSSHLCGIFATGLALYATLGTMRAVPIFIAHGIRFTDQQDGWRYKDRLIRGRAGDAARVDRKDGTGHWRPLVIG